MSGQSISTANGTGRALNIASWVCQTLLVLLFLAAGSAKLLGSQEMVDAFDEIGRGQWLRYFVGVVEIAGVLGLLVPRLMGLAALGLTTLMICAIVTNVVMDDLSLMDGIAFTLSVSVAWLRRDRTKALLRPRAAD
ncbi:DoxX family protein [Streptomyces sp. NPDC058739]|uniref:DoxX family protein n=1 Tax=Streptomyces sp. NPDC058739 TaxID=3346618 RepID=UPI0036A61E38